MNIPDRSDGLDLNPLEELFRLLLLCFIVVAFRVLVLQPGENNASTLTEQRIFPSMTFLYSSSWRPYDFPHAIIFSFQTGSHHPQTDAIHHRTWFGETFCVFVYLYRQIVISFLVVSVRDSCNMPLPCLVGV